MKMKKIISLISQTNVAQRHKCATVKALVVGSDPTLGMKYLIFSYPDSSNDAMHGVEFRHATRFGSRIWRKVANGSVVMETECVNTRFPGSLYSAEQYETKK